MDGQCLPLSFAVLLISAAGLGDRHGRGRMFSFGVSLFGTASVGCALAPSAGECRASQDTPPKTGRRCTVLRTMYGRTYWGMERTTFVIGPDGVIAHVFRKVKPVEHDQKVLSALAA